MRKVIVTLVVLVLVVMAVVLVAMYSGRYNISTGNHDFKTINWFFDKGMTRSVAFHAKGITPPPLDDPAMVQEGAMHYQEMCVMCHGGPGVQPDEIAEGLWPHAPKLQKTADEWTPAELFWITKNGIKFSAMPAWGPTHSDDKIWALVAFLKKESQLSPEEYAAMVKSSGAETEHEEHH